MTSGWSCCIVQAICQAPSTFPTWAQLVKNLPAIRKSWVQSLGQEDPRRREKLPTPVFCPGEFHDCIVHRVAKSQIQLRDFHFPLPHQMQSNSPINKPIKDCSIKIQKCPGANRQVQWQFTALPCNVLNISGWCKSGFPGSQTQRFRLQCRWWFGEEGDPWVRKIPWRRAWQPTPVFLPGESLWTEEPGGLQSMGLQRVGHDWVTNAKTWCMGYSPWGCKESDTTEWLTLRLGVKTSLGWNKLFSDLIVYTGWISGTWWLLISKASNTLGSDKHAQRVTVN